MWLKTLDQAWGVKKKTFLAMPTLRLYSASAINELDSTWHFVLKIPNSWKMEKYLIVEVKRTDNLVFNSV